MVSLGVVSAVGGPWRTPRGGRVDGYLRTDATMYPGFSGGPLVDAGGRVLGINSSWLGRGEGLAIQTEAAESVVEALLAHGRIRRGYLGISSQPARLAEPFEDSDAVLLAVNVEQDSPADKAGLLVGDALVSLDGQRFRNHEELQGLLGSEVVGKSATLTIVRGGERRELSVVVGERP